MILFYLKDTGEIISAIHGRAHSADQLEIKISHGGVPDDKIGKFVVPSVRTKKEVLPTMPFREAILKVERQEARAMDFKLTTDEKGEVVGIKKKKKE